MAFALDILKLALFVWLAVLAFLFLREVFLTSGSLRGILSSKQNQSADPERVALMVFTIGVALHYALTTVGSPTETLTSADGTVSLPDIRVEVLVLMFGTQGSYLLGKFFRTFRT